MCGYCGKRGAFKCVVIWLFIILLQGRRREEKAGLSDVFK